MTDSLTVVLAPDSFKGTLTSLDVARALAEGWARARPGDELLLAPLADGGEGTLAAIAAAGGWRRLETSAGDPIGRPVTAGWLLSEDGTRAVVELAEASGLTRLATDERDPRGATTVGTGEVLRAALDAGVRQIDLGIGGSATTDGGWGILQALGARRVGAAAEHRDRRGGGLGAERGDRIAGGRIDLAGLDPRLAQTRLRIACDVSNPLLGEHGAAAVYCPQKGATRADVTFLEARLDAYADALEAATGRRERDTPGAGAAGGVGFGLLCLRGRFRSLELVPGVELVAEETGLDAKLARADLVITGEGRIDAQTAFGKTALGVAYRAQAAHVRCIAVGGGVESEGAAALEALGVEVVPVHEVEISLAEAIAAGAAPLVACGARLAGRIARDVAARPGRDLD
jgi:glycerate kinase